MFECRCPRNISRVWRDNFVSNSEFEHKVMVVRFNLQERHWIRISLGGWDMLSTCLQNDSFIVRSSARQVVVDWWVGVGSQWRERSMKITTCRASTNRVNRYLDWGAKDFLSGDDNRGFRFIVRLIHTPYLLTLRSFKYYSTPCWKRNMKYW